MNKILPEWDEQKDSITFPARALYTNPMDSSIINPSFTDVSLQPRKSCSLHKSSISSWVTSLCSTSSHYRRENKQQLSHYRIQNMQQLQNTKQAAILSRYRTQNKQQYCHITEYTTSSNTAILQNTKQAAMLSHYRTQNKQQCYHHLNHKQITNLVGQQKTRHR